MAKLHEAVERFRGPLDEYFDRTVGDVSHPTLQTEVFRMALDKEAEANALDHPVNQQVHSPLISRQLCHGVTL